MTAPSHSAGSAEEPAMPVPLAITEAGDVLHSGDPGLTKRQHAAILLRDPTSGEPWLDAMIERARLREVATALATAYAEWGGENPGRDGIQHARSLLSRLDGEVKP